MAKTISKQTIYIIAFSIIIILVFIVVLIFKGEDNLPQTVESSIYLYSENSDIFIKKPNSNIYEKLTSPKTLIFEGYAIKTTDSYAHVKLIDNSFISITPYSEMVVKVSNKNKTIINQTIGNSWHRVKSVPENIESSYEVETKGILTSVNGTEFAVMTANDETHIFVKEGEIQAKNNFDQIELKANEYVITDQNELKKIEPSNEFLKSNFYKRNLEIEEDKIKDFDVSQYTSDMIDAGIFNFDSELFEGFSYTPNTTQEEDSNSIDNSLKNESDEKKSNQLPVLRLPSNRFSSNSSFDVSFSTSSSIILSDLTFISRPSSDFTNYTSTTNSKPNSIQKNTDNSSSLSITDHNNSSSFNPSWSSKSNAERYILKNLIQD